MWRCTRAWMLRSNGPATTAELCCWPQAKSKKPINLTSPRNQPPIARCQENQPRAQTKRNTPRCQRNTPRCQRNKPRCQRNKPRCQRNKSRCQKKQPLNTHSGTAWRPCGTVMAHHQPNFGLVSFSRVIEKPTACTSWMGSAREAVGLNKCGLPRQTPRGQKSARWIWWGKLSSTKTPTPWTPRPCWANTKCCSVEHGKTSTSSNVVTLAARSFFFWSGVRVQEVVKGYIPVREFKWYSGWHVINTGTFFCRITVHYIVLFYLNIINLNKIAFYYFIWVLI